MRFWSKNILSGRVNLVVNEHEGIGFQAVTKKTWPVILRIIPLTFTTYQAWAAVNILVISKLFWPLDEFHAQEMGIGMGLAYISWAISQLIFGVLADRHSRVKLLGINAILQGILFGSIGFLQPGLGLTSFIFFFTFGLSGSLVGGGAQTIANSFVSDATEENERSKFFGILGLIGAVITNASLLLMSFLFQDYWRVFFWIVGAGILISGIVILSRAKEPRRGIAKNELKNILTLSGVDYTYQLTRETMRSTLLSKTNLLVFFEGPFTQAILAVPYFLVYAYLQSPPYNLSPQVTGLITVIFAVLGTSIGTALFAKLSDKLGQKNIKSRIYLIIFGLVSTYACWIMFSLIPLPALSKSDGANLAIIFSQTAIWLVCAFICAISIVGTLFSMNQLPIIQKINLPEAQGTMTSANGFFGIMGSGVGIMIAGSIYAFFGNNFPITVIIMCLIGLCGMLFWIAAKKFIKRDMDLVSEILKHRASEMETIHKNGTQ